MRINLVSDTVTKPSQEMLRFMFQAEVGDDVYHEDPTVRELEAKVAQMFGMEAGLFFPSGTMANQVAIKLNTQPGERLIAEKTSHIYNCEDGAVAFNSGVSCAAIEGERGKFTAHQLENHIRQKNLYYTKTALVCVENTTNMGGGACYAFEEFQKMRQVCDHYDLKFHLDGARIWNALLVTKDNPANYGKVFDTISVCLSKGLGAPIGSLLLSDKKSIEKARYIRRTLGGGMRQVGYLAAAGIYAISHNINGLFEDHRRAKEIAAVLQKLNWVAQVVPVETNIVIFSLHPQINQAVVIEKLKEKGIEISVVGAGKLRIVTHLDYREVMHTYVLEALLRMNIG